VSSGEEVLGHERVLDLRGHAEQEDDVVAAVELRRHVDPDGVGRPRAEVGTPTREDDAALERVVEARWLGVPWRGGEHGTQMPADPSAHGFPRKRRRPRQTGEKAAKLAQVRTAWNRFRRRCYLAVPIRVVLAALNRRRGPSVLTTR
jgi:hypothetical protein